MAAHTRLLKFPGFRFLPGNLSSSGSALIGVVALTLVIAIAGTGYLAAVSTGINNDRAALDRDAALYAAESGLQLGANWLRAQPALLAVGNTESPFSQAIVDTVNGISVNVKVTGISNNEFEIKAEAYKNTSTFLKRLRMRAHANDLGRYQTFIDGLRPVPNLNGQNWQGMGGGKVFNGRFHWNSTVDKFRVLSGANNLNLDQGLRFNYPVTVAQMSIRNNTRWNFNSAAANPDASGTVRAIVGLSDYSTGLLFADDPANDANRANYANKLFAYRGNEPAYKGSVDPIDLADNLTQFSSLLGPSDILVLPTDTKVGLNATASDLYRPYLEFVSIPNQSIRAIYRYNMDYTTGTYDSAEYYVEDVAGKVIQCHTDLSVKGQYNSNITVATDEGASIVVVGDLINSDFNIAQKDSEADNYGIPLASNNVLGLVSGKNVVFNRRWKEFSSGTVTRISGSTAATRVDGGGSELFVHANMVMANANQKALNQGFEVWEGDKIYDFYLTHTGSHVMNYWVRSCTAGDPYGGRRIHYNYDARFADRIRPPGFQPLKTTTGLWVLSYTNWTEENTL